MSITETMNKNILSRFETKSEGTKITKYSIKFHDGKSCTRVFMNIISHCEAIQSISDTFGTDKIREVVKL